MYIIHNEAEVFSKPEERNPITKEGIVKKAKEIVKEMVADEQKKQPKLKRCKHGLGDASWCAYCKGYGVSDYPSSVGLTHIRAINAEEDWKTQNPAFCE